MPTLHPMTTPISAHLEWVTCCASTRSGWVEISPVSVARHCFRSGYEMPSLKTGPTTKSSSKSSSPVAQRSRLALQTSTKSTVLRKTGWKLLRKPSSDSGWPARAVINIPLTSGPPMTTGTLRHLWARLAREVEPSRARSFWSTNPAEMSSTSRSQVSVAAWRFQPSSEKSNR